MQRAVQILSLLPDPDNIDLSDERAVANATADVRLLLAEFKKVSDEMDEIGDAVACLH